MKLFYFIKRRIAAVQFYNCLFSKKDDSRIVPLSEKIGIANGYSTTKRGSRIGFITNDYNKFSFKIEFIVNDYTKRGFKIGFIANGYNKTGFQICINCEWLQQIEFQNWIHCE